MRKLLSIIILINLVSCFPFSTRKQKIHKDDFISLSEEDYAKKYYSIPFKSTIDFTKLKKNQAYLISRNNDAFQIFVFSDNGYVYSTSLIYDNNLNNIPSQKLFKVGVFTNSLKKIKKEKIVSNPEGLFGFIEEGSIKNDTIFMTRNYQTDKPNKRRSQSENYIYTPDIKVFKLGDVITIESK